MKVYNRISGPCILHHTLKGEVLDSCVVPGSTYGLETLALSELHQHKLQVCENNWIRKIAGVRRVERRRMEDLREEACIVGKIVESRMKWAGHGRIWRHRRMSPDCTSAKWHSNLNHETGWTCFI